jgi:hypothetical protein
VPLWGAVPPLAMETREYGETESISRQVDDIDALDVFLEVDRAMERVAPAILRFAALYFLGHILLFVFN